MEEETFHKEVRPNRRLHFLQCQHFSGAQAAAPGDIPVAIFVHGAGGRKEQFNSQIEQFKKTHKIVAFDMLGHGQSDKPADWHAYSTSELVQDLWEIVHSTVLAPSQQNKNILVGHSYGTSLILKLLARLEEGEGYTSSQYFHKVVLIGAAAVAPPGTSHPIWYLPNSVLEWLRPLMAGGFEGKAWHPSTDRELVLREAEVSSRNPMNRPLFRQMAWITEEEIRRIKLPVLCISGRTDGLTPADSAKNFEAWLEQARLHVLENASHMVHMEQAEQVNQLIHEFLQQQQQQEEEEEED